MFKLQRASFPQLLLAAFLLIAGLLAAASLQGLVTLQGLMVQSQAASERALRETSIARQLAEHSVAMERAGRQYVVLQDPILLRRFEHAATEATRGLQALVAQQLPPDLAGRWQAQLDDITSQVHGGKAAQRQRDELLAAGFGELESINGAIAEQVREAGEQRNHALQTELERGRAELGQEVLGAIVLAVALALGFATWLTRPLRRLEKAIIDLGENRLEDTIAIQGPRDLHALGKKLDWLRLRLKELDDDKSRFLRHVSHELKTPLAALREGVSLLEDGVAGALTADQREIARILGHNAQMLQSQIEDLLRFNAAAFEARHLQRRPIELAGLLKALIDGQRLQWQAKALRMAVEGGPLHVEADADKLGVALGNLLSNAIRFSPRGGHVQFTLGVHKGRARIDLRDEGVGVAQADRDRIFEPFYRGEHQPDDAVRGTGIGLSIVREYIDAHGGRVELMPPGSGAHGTGAHFRIELPHVV
jgi:two-component system sensor histidine kinase GlrK